jgi:hypothetical protein
MGTQLGQNGTCVATTDANSPKTYNEGENAAHEACLDTLLPKRPIPLVQTPGAFFVGYAWGSSSKQFVYGPQVGIGAAILFPLHRPSLTLEATTAPPNTALPASSTFTFSLPKDMTCASALAVSLNADFASFTFPNATTAQVGTSGSTQQTFNVGIYLGPQFGWQWWEAGSVKSVMFSLGLLAGYINTQATGAAFVLGIQPGLVAQF